VIVFDKRGQGLSDRVAEQTLEERIGDVRAVMDAADSRRATTYCPRPQSFLFEPHGAWVSRARSTVDRCHPFTVSYEGLAKPRANPLCSPLTRTGHDTCPFVVTGARCAMVKMIICLRRGPELTPEAFKQHWRDVHAPLVLRHATTLGIKRYVQVYAHEAAPTGGRPEGFDAIGEIWIESVEAFRAALATPEGAVAARELRESDAFLTDLSRSPRTFGTEITIIG
jgi:uncharacterized protein (TIGR02118 family)